MVVELVYSIWTLVSVVVAKDPGRSGANFKKVRRELRLIACLVVAFLIVEWHKAGG
jgi:hypothetical protein